MLRQLLHAAGDQLTTCVMLLTAIARFDSLTGRIVPTGPPLELPITAAIQPPVVPEPTAD